MGDVGRLNSSDDVGGFVAMIGGSVVALQEDGLWEGEGEWVGWDGIG